MPSFLQEPPRLANPYSADANLRQLLARLLPAEVHDEIAPGLEALGVRVADELESLAAEAEAQPPRHVPYDAWGRRIDRIEISPAWRRLHAIAAEEGIVATAYERRHGALARVHQFARLYLYHPSSAVCSCPLAMSDAAARVLLAHGSDELREHALPHLTSRDPAQLWTSGQWMTERTGGSDVGGTETVAEPDGRGDYRLTGVKWFTSATTSEMALTLARLPGAATGSRGLTTFYLEPFDADGNLQAIEILRLKDKLGTRALPTAELELRGTPARQVGEAGRGVATIATMLNVTRLWNACCAAASLGRALQLACDYAARREAFGRRLSDHPLHTETLESIAAEHAAATHLVFRCAELLGRVEHGEASVHEQTLLRLLTPLAKALTGKQVVAGVSEALECFGGAGYLEDTGLPRLLRDAQVLPIWEGTTNVLALDFLRALDREGGPRALFDDLERRLARAGGAELAPAADRLRAVAGERRRWLEQAAGDRRQAGARALGLGLARVYAGALLVEQAAWETARGTAAPTLELALRWAARHLDGSIAAAELEPSPAAG